MLNILKQYFAFAGRNSRDLKLGVLWQIINSIGASLQLLAIYVVIRDMDAGAVSAMTALYAFLILLASMLLFMLAAYFGRIREARGSFNMCADKRTQIGDRLKYLPMGFFNKVSMGKITATATNTLDNLQNEGTLIMVQVSHGLINAAVLVLFMVILDLRMGALVLVGLLLFLIVSLMVRKKSESLYPVRHKAQVAIVGAVLEYVQGISVIRSFNLAKMARGRLAEAVKNCEKQNITLELAFIPLLMLQSLIFKASSIGVIILSLVFYIDGSMSAPMTILMIMASFVVFREIELSGAMASLSMLVERAIADVKAQLTAPVMTETGKKTEASGFDIRCENISFSYEKRKIIDNLSLEIKERTTTAIVGPSGGGKTTICRLIPRFWDVDEGRITLGGKDIRDYKPDDLLGHFSMVFQNVYLFNDTVANNIKFGRPDATEEEIREAARKACCADFIEALPQGYDTLIGEGGATISGGEKQRISIARALLKDAPIVILDEATANVDPENEKELQQAIEELTRDKTIIMIAHRLKTVRNADQILVIEGGCLREKGTHRELMANGKTYAAFVGRREQSMGWKLGDSAY